MHFCKGQNYLLCANGFFILVLWLWKLSFRDWTISPIYSRPHLQQVIKYIELEVEQFKMLMLLILHLDTYFLWVKLLWKLSLGFKLTLPTYLPTYLPIYLPTYLYLPTNLLHLIHVIAQAHASTHATSLIRVKNSTHHFCLRHWNKECQRKTKNIRLSNCVSSFFFTVLSLAWMLYFHVWLHNK